MEKKSTQNNWVIKCIHCGAEFHPSEIFMPDDLTGKPKPNGIIKDPLNKILYVDFEDEPMLSQVFECPECGKPFQVDAVVNYKVSKLPEEEDFSTDMVSLL